MRLQRGTLSIQTRQVGRSAVLCSNHLVVSDQITMNQEGGTSVFEGVFCFRLAHCCCVHFCWFGDHHCDDVRCEVRSFMLMNLHLSFRRCLHCENRVNAWPFIFTQNLTLYSVRHLRSSVSGTTCTSRSCCRCCGRSTGRT